jgi:hypothetical protein
VHILSDLSVCTLYAFTEPESFIKKYFTLYRSEIDSGLPSPSLPLNPSPSRKSILLANVHSSYIVCPVSIKQSVKPHLCMNIRWSIAINKGNKGEMHEYICKTCLNLHFFILKYHCPWHSVYTLMIHELGDHTHHLLCTPHLLSSYLSIVVFGYTGKIHTCDEIFLVVLFSR